MQHLYYGFLLDETVLNACPQSFLFLNPVMLPKTKDESKTYVCGIKVPQSFQTFPNEDRFRLISQSTLTTASQQFCLFLDHLVSEARQSPFEKEEDKNTWISFVTSQTPTLVSFWMELS